MEKYHNFLAEAGPHYAKRVYWQEDKQLFQSNLDHLRQTMSRLRAVVLEFEGLTEIAHLNIASTYALGSDINATAEQLGLSPIPLDSISLLKTPENDK